MGAGVAGDGVAGDGAAGEGVAGDSVAREGGGLSICPVCFVNLSYWSHKCLCVCRLTDTTVKILTVSRR